MMINVEGFDVVDEASTASVSPAIIAVIILVVVCVVVPAIVVVYYRRRASRRRHLPWDPDVEQPYVLAFVYVIRIFMQRWAKFNYCSQLLGEKNRLTIS